ncbi:MAG: glycosyltransferase [Actinomycetota bacterium]|nr:glycosyltransferase [Actinomycetota bacterium]
MTRTPEQRVQVVIVTMNRHDDLARTLRHLRDLPERPGVVVVDNGSTPPVESVVRDVHPDAEVLTLPHNLGGAGRTEGVRRCTAPYVAFCDDDSWWAPRSLRRAADLFDAHPVLGLVAARVLVGPEQRLDPISAIMAESPLPGRDGVGPGVLGFLACGAVVRREAYLAVGGFHRQFGIGGEEALLAMDLADGGWDLCYVDDLVAHHHPATTTRDPSARRRRQWRNDLWTLALRRRMGTVLRGARAAVGDPVGRGALYDAVRGVPWVARERRRLGRDVEARLRLLEAAG